MSGVNFFDTVTDYDFSSLKVYVNDKLTNIPANALTAAAGDDISIVSRSDLYPFFYPSDKDYIASIEEPLPFMGNTNFSNYFLACRSLVSIPENLFINNPQITSFDSCFNSCDSLTSIPQGLFDNNPNVTDFRSCFWNCNSLTSIPQGLFDNNPNVTDFGYCFFSLTALTSIPEGLFNNNLNATYFNFCFFRCTSLTSIPLGLFNNNLNATDFSSCFQRCTSLKVNVQIGSTTTNRVYVTNFADRTAATGTVYCRAGSKAYEAFSSTSIAYVNVLTY